MPIQQDGSLIVGVARPKYNPIINRMYSEVGKPRPSCMPHTRLAEFQDYTYGAPTKTDSETAGSIMFNWPKAAAPKTQVDVLPSIPLLLIATDAACSSWHGQEA